MTTAVFVLVGVPVGTVQIQVQPLGYDKQVQEVQVSAGADRDAELRLRRLQGGQADRGDRGPRREADRRQELGDQAVHLRREAQGASGRRPALRGRASRPAWWRWAASSTSAADAATRSSSSSTASRCPIRSAAAAPTSPTWRWRAPSCAPAEFDAEFGNALSGVVSVNTREGTDQFRGEVRWDTDRYGDPSKTFDNYDRFTFGFGGPTPIKKLTYYATYEGTFTDTYLKSTMTKSPHTLFDFLQFGFRQ